jgi:shikimate dehydrogenase
MEMTVSGLQTGRDEGAGTELIRTGLIGRGILASRSPWMHESEAKAQGFALSYELFDFTARGWSDAELGHCLSDIHQAGFAGVNVTHPFKQEVIGYVDALAPSAQAVGAVNTVAFVNGKSIGHNTDMSGFAASFKLGLSGASFDQVLQFGAGGAGSATANALLSLGTNRLILVDDDTERAIALSDCLAKSYPERRVEIASASELPFVDVDGIVNATPMGMDAHPGVAFDVSQLCSESWVADIVYFPIETELLRAARAKGCRTLNGKGMAVFQAADAFQIFTGRKAENARMLCHFDGFGAATAP